MSDIKNKITKADIINTIHAGTDSEIQKNLDKKTIHFVIDAFFEVIKDSLLDDKIIELRGFGTFEIRSRKGRQNARNPKTSAPVTVPTHGVAVFRPGKNLKKEAWSLGKDNA